MAKVKVIVIDKKCYPELLEKYCADPNIEKGNGKDDFWHMLDGKFCSEAWDCVSRYIYAGLQGGSIMEGWMKEENEMIACCNDGTRPVIFKIERVDE